jgi:lipopolysaccharide transport system permease protein
MFGKVYFPRLTVPVSTVISSLVSLGIQLSVLIALSLYFYATGSNLQPNVYLLAVPLLILIMSGLSLGLGIIVSALTTKYRDLSYFLGFGVQLFMFATPVVYPATYVPASYQWLVKWNPMAPIIESFRYACFGGEGFFDWSGVGFSLLATFAILGIGVVLFNKVEKTFMDTV